jgi:SAM-dependent methyltransferase
MRVAAKHPGVTDEARLSRFYGAMTSIDGIVAAIDADGLDRNRLTAADVYTRGLDCHNLGGFAQLERVTATAASVEQPNNTDRLLDVGCGLGGPSRFLADRYGCRVVGIDLLQVRVDVARALTEMTRFGDKVEYRVADALALPFDSGSFAQAWVIDASIHIRDKPALFAELARVIRSGGLLVLHDQLGPLPVAMRPARRAAPYIALSLPQMIRVVEAAGFRVKAWRDTTVHTLAWFHHLRDRLAARAPSDVIDDDGGPLGHAVLDGYVETLEGPDGRTGILVARRR